MEDVSRTTSDPSGTVRPKIVIAGTDGDMREYVKELLGPHCELIVAGDGLQALRAIAQSSPHWVLSDASFLQTLEIISEGVIVVDAAGCYAYVNREAEHLLGYRREQLLGKSIHEVTPAIEGGDIGANIALVAADRNVRSFEIYSDVLKRWFGFKVHPAAADGVVIHFSDITDRKRADLTLHDAQEETRQAKSLLAEELRRMRKLHEASTALMHEGDLRALLKRILYSAIDIMGADKGSVQLLDASSGQLNVAVQYGLTAEFCKLFDSLSLFEGGQESAPVNSRRVVITDMSAESNFADAGVRQRLLAMDIRSLQSTPIVTADGRLVGIISSYWCLPHEPGGQELRLLDMLARQAADLIERTQRQQELVEADRRKDEFLATLAHELRNPLAAISSATMVLMRAGDRPELARAAGSALKRQVAQMSRLLEDLLDVARISRGRLELRKTVVPVASIVAAAVETVRALIDERRHVLTVEVPPEPLFIEADEVRMIQVLSNLISNAAKYTDKNGAILLAVGQRGGEVEFRVKDNGIGISAAALSSVFEMFSQETSALERSEGGLGIGLALVRGLVQMHRGRVIARSEGRGKGSEFTVIVPLAVSRPAQKPAPGLQGQETKIARRILIADDNRDAVASLATVLRLDGHEILVAHDGLEALDLADKERPQILLLDIGMPYMNGYELAAAIRRRNWPLRPRIIAMSGWGRPEDKQRAEEAGFDLHLTKPIDIEALRRAFFEPLEVAILSNGALPLGSP